MKTKAFTLVEILITLLVIGIVATVTIPIINSTIQDRQFREAAKEAYSKAFQAVQLMKQDKDGDLSYYYTHWGSFKPVFIKYFKFIQDCGWSDCVADSNSSTVYKSLHGDAGNTHNMQTGQFITNDGMFYGIYNGGDGLIFITVDVNGYTKGPNIFGRDTFMFQLISPSDKLVPMGTSGSFVTGLCTKTESNNRQGFSCMYNIMNGIDYAY